MDLASSSRWAGVAALIVAVVALVGVAQPAAAQQAPPNRVFGTVQLNGATPPAGTVITAFIGGMQCGGGQVRENGMYVADVVDASQTAGCGMEGAVVTFRVGGVQAGQTLSFQSGMFTELNLVAPGMPAAQRYSESLLSLADPRPCVPEAGQTACDATRTALWNGDQAAWAARGITDGDARFNETVVFRVRGGDPAAISAIARIIGSPYLKVTRVHYGAGTEFAEVTNLGGGSQDMTGWTLRSPARSATFSFPAGFSLTPGQACRVYSGPAGPNPCGTGASFNQADVWPEDAGQVVLFFDALALPGDDVRYSANPNSQPPPPNLVGDSSSLQ